MNSSKKWEIKVFFAYADNDPDHLRVEILKGAPLLKQVNDIIDAVKAHLDRCRQSWWTFVSDICLINQSLTISPTGVLTKTGIAAGTKVTAAQYQPTNRSVAFRGLAMPAWIVGTCP
ncbi:MAG: hypothetical protein ORN28_09645 [Rhodoferax sp.]|nr:hypothetical protein [Rhodoferax sp.]